MLARFCVVALVALTSAASATTWTVRLDGSGDFTAIQPALTGAAPGDTILVADGTYTGTDNRDLSFGGKDLVVLGESDDPAACVIDCAAGPGDEARGFVFDGAETGAAVLRGFTVTGGWVSGRGGGILLQSANLDSVPAPRIENCVLTLNRAGSGGGGGIAVVGFSVPHLTDCVITANTGGGGLWTGIDDFDSAGASLVESCEFSGNTGPGLQVGGDGFYPWDRNLVFRGCAVSGNTGTGLQHDNLSGIVAAEACILSSNGGWGVTFPFQASPNKPVQQGSRFGRSTLVDCEITSNQAGGIVGESDIESFIRCTVSGNFGHGIECGISDEVDIVDCIIEDNEGDGVNVAGYAIAFHGNTIRGNGGFGARIDWYNGGAIDLLDNVITENVGTGLIFLSGSSNSDVLLQNNVIAGNGANGLTIDGVPFTQPFEILENTIANNTLDGIACLTPVDLAITSTIIAGNGQEALAGQTSATLACTDLYGNLLGDYTGDLASQLGVDGNIAANPMFCDPSNGVYTIHALSPGLDGNHPDGFACGEIGALGMGCPPPHAGGDWNVSVGGDDFFNDGTGGSPFASIQQAITLAAPGDTIVVGIGTYTGDGNRDLDLGGKDLVIRSESEDPADCVIDCGGGPGDEHRGFVFSGLETGATTICGFTIRGGWVTGDGGGILLQSAGEDSLPAPRIERCVLEGNTADRGAGLAIIGLAAPQLIDCAFTNNLGQGVAIVGPAVSPGLLLSGSLVAGNSQGGILVDVTAPTGGLALAGLTVADNGGHGIECVQPIDLELDQSIIAFNHLRALTGHDLASDLACVDIFGNAGGDFVDDLAAWSGVQGNFSADPWFVDRLGRDYRLIDISPCAAGNHPDGEACGLVGALAVGGLAAPLVTEVSDVGNDQGRQVRLIWEASDFDRPASSQPVTGYGVYRRQDDAAPPAPRIARDLPLPLPGWDFLMTVPARGDAAYQYVAATLCDSTAAGICWSTFLVSAMTDDPYTYFDSDPAQGYSVDNIVPPAPAGFTVEYRPDTYLSWQPADAPDLAWYNIYRGDTADFTPTTANRVAQVTGTHWTDLGAGWDYHYLLSAVDNATNESQAIPPDHEVAVYAELPGVTALVGNAPNPFNPATTIAFTLASDLPVSLRVYDLTGRLVRTLVADEHLPRGRHEALWMGRDDHGRSVASGMYLYRLQAGDVVETRRMALIK